MVDDVCQGMASGILIFTSSMSLFAYSNLFYFFWRLEAHWSTLDDWIGVGTMSTSEERPLIPGHNDTDIEALVGKMNPEDAHVGEISRSKSEGSGMVVARAIKPIIFKNHLLTDPVNPATLAQIAGQFPGAYNSGAPGTPAFAHTGFVAP